MNPETLPELPMETSDRIALGREQAAMRECLYLLLALDKDQRRRAMSWLVDYIGTRDCGGHK